MLGNVNELPRTSRIFVSAVHTTSNTEQMKSVMLGAKLRPPPDTSYTEVLTPQ